MKRTGLIIVAIVMVATVVGVCVKMSREGGSPAGTGSEMPKIRIIDGLSANSPYVFLADKMGFFKEQGLDATVSYTALGKLAMDALNAGSVEYAGVVEMNVAHTLFKHKDVAVLCEYSEPTTGIKVLGRRDRGVETAADLRGKKVGVFYGVNIHIFIVKLIEEAGIPVNEVELVNLKPPDSAAAFISGSIDAVITWEPIVSNIRQKLGEDAVLITEDARRYWPYKLILATKRSYLDGHGHEAKAVLRALVMAEDFMEKHPEKVHEMLAEHLKLDREKVPGICEEIHYEIRITPELLDMIAFETTWLPKHLPAFFEGKEPVTTDFESLVGDELKSVKPEAFALP